MLTGDQAVAVSRAAAAPDVPLSAFGLDDTAEVRAAVKAEREWTDSLPEGAIVEVPSEWPTAGPTDWLYPDPSMHVDALAREFFPDLTEAKVDATGLEAERFLADVDDEPESKREYVRDDHGRFATVGLTSRAVQSIGSNRHGSGYLDASDHTIIASHMNRAAMSIAYNDAYDRGRAARDSDHGARSLNERHAQLRTSIAELRKVGTARALTMDAEVHAFNALDSAGYIDGMLGQKRRYHRLITGDTTRGVVRGTTGVVGALFGKSFDPNQPRDPHTGEWIGHGGVNLDDPLEGITYGRTMSIPGLPGVEGVEVLHRGEPVGHVHQNPSDAWVAEVTVRGSTIRRKGTTRRNAVNLALSAAQEEADDQDFLTEEEKRLYVRDDNGRFAHVPGAHVAWGATLNPDTGEEPTSGYVVAVQGHNQEIPEEEFFSHMPRSISAYVKAQRDNLHGDPAAPRMLGLWHDKTNHEVVLDVVEVFDDQQAAVTAGAQRNQQAIWDVANGVEIATGGTGDRAAEGKAGRPDPAAGEPGGDDRRGDRRLVGAGRGEDREQDPAFLLSEEKREYVRDWHGQFARVPTHSGMRVTEGLANLPKAQANLLDDPTHTDVLPPELRDKMVATAAGMGATPESLQAQIEATLDRAIARTGNPPRGHDWYEQAHGELQRAARTAGVTDDQMTGATAAYSPQMAWAPNLAAVQYIAENRDEPVHTEVLSATTTRKIKGEDGKAHPVTRTNYEWVTAEVDGRNIDGEIRHVPPVADLEGKTFADLDPYLAAALMKQHAQQGIGRYDGQPLNGRRLEIADDITGVQRGVNFSNSTSGGRALRIIRGEDPNLILNGHKVRSFYNNLSDPTADDGDVTVDSHAVSLALGRKISSQSPEYNAFASRPSNATLGVRGSYPLWADAYRAVAAKRGLRPSQVQAIAWIQWRFEHPDNARTTHLMD